jgi:hypothetical protein
MPLVVTARGKPPTARRYKPCIPPIVGLHLPIGFQLELPDPFLVYSYFRECRNLLKPGDIPCGRQLSQQTAGAPAGRCRAALHVDAVDEDVVDARGRFFSGSHRGVVGNGVGIEDDDVRSVAPL